MRTSYSSILALALASATTILAQNIQPTMVVRGVAQADNLQIASGGALDPQATPKPNVAGSSSLTIQITNKQGASLTISYAHNAGGPTPIGNPETGVLGSSTQAVFPTGWAGRINIGKTGPVDPKSSKIEGSFTGQPNVDVSYVDGYAFPSLLSQYTLLSRLIISNSYTVPIVCSCADKVVTGCNLGLYHLGNTCPNKGPGDICYNTAENLANGPAPPFFAPCKGAAYTYPNDNLADSGCNVDTISCCIGTDCPANPNQPKTKRDYISGRLTGETMERIWAGGISLRLCGVGWYHTLDTYSSFFSQ